MKLSADANFCPRCGKATEHSAANNHYSVNGAASGQAGPDNEMQMALAAALRANTLSGGMGGKVQTSPFPGLPETSAGAGLPNEKLSGQTIHALLAQANLHRMRHQWDESIDCCVAVLRLQPANQTAHVLLGDVYRDQNRLDDAIQWYGMAVDLRPNPTDQAKLEQVKQQRERHERMSVLRTQRGYGDSSVSAIDRETDLNTGTQNLMGLSPRRWLRGITTISVAFVMLALVALVWNRAHGNANANAKTPRARAPFGTGSFDMPSHHLDKTLPSYTVIRAANGNRPVVTGGAGLPPDRNAHTTTAPAVTRAMPTPSTPPSGSTLPAFGSGAQTSANATPLLNVPPASVQEVRPLSSAEGNVTAQSAPPSNRLTDGLQQARTVADGGVGATVLLTGAPSLVLDSSSHGQEILLRNVYRAARTAFANNMVLMKVKVFIQTQTATAGQAVVLEAELDRSTANNANPDTDAAASLLNRLAYFRYVGDAATSVPAPGTSETGLK